MRDQHRPTGEILHWLWLQGVKIHAGHLTAFWQRRAIASQNAAAPPPSDPPPTAPPNDQPKNPSAKTRHDPATKPTPAKVTPHPSNASHSSHPPQAKAAAAQTYSAKLAGMMNNYLDFTNDLMSKCRADPNPKPEDRQQIDRMLQIAMDYERSQFEQAHRQRVLELKQAEHELRVKRAAQAEKREKAKAKAREEADAERKPPRDFDNTDLIADMRGELFREVYTPENLAAVEAALAKAEAGIDPFNNPNVIHSG
jgi:hypothetical protein